MSRDAAEVARLCADAMWKEDEASRSLGMTLDKIGPGHALLSMKVGVNMVNGHGSCHGGFIFMLADSAFDVASFPHQGEFIAPSAPHDLPNHFEKHAISAFRDQLEMPFVVERDDAFRLLFLSQASV